MRSPRGSGAVSFPELGSPAASVKGRVSSATTIWPTLYSTPDCCAAARAGRSPWHLPRLGLLKQPCDRAARGEKAQQTIEQGQGQAKLIY